MTATTSPRFTIADVEDLLSDIRERTTRLDQRLHLMEHYPHLSERFLNWHLGTLLRMDAVQLIEVLGHPDPTGETATRRAMEAA